MNSQIKIEISKKQEHIERALKIRRDVFASEQGIKAELNLDPYDDGAFHALAYLEDEIIGTARLVQETDSLGYIARVSVVKEYRSLGVGKKLIQALEEKAKTISIQKLVIFAHKHLEQYYRKLDYQFICSAGIINDHQLIQMEKKVEY